MKKKSPMKNPGIQIESSYKLTVQKPKFPNEDSNYRGKLFDCLSIETEAAPYNLITPGVSQSDKTNVSTSPALLAMGSKSHRTRSTLGPSVVKPIISNIKMSTVQDFNSLITKKPLSELPIPTKKKVTTVAQQNENERNELMFKDDPITYFSKHKDDGMGHRLIYLKYAKSQNDPYFSPYDLIKTPFCDAGDDYFTMSASGITHVDEFGNTETCSLDSWVKEETDFAMIRRLRLFKLYLFWKPFKFWRTFVQRQRYKELTKEVKSIPSLYNGLICKSQITISKLTRKFDKLMNKTLLTLIPQQKYVLKDYEELCNQNNITLQNEYEHFIHSAVLIFTELYDQISNPNKLLVKENEFDEIKRKNPNVGRLIILEQKKEEKRIQNDEKMKTEIGYLQNTIRMADYMFLERLQDNCCKSLRQANENVESESSAIFNAEITFNENGEVEFIPNEIELTKTVINSIDMNLKTLEDLPRILFQPELSEFLQKQSDYPTFAQFLSSSDIVQTIKENISNVISESYHNAFISSKSFCDYYPLFKLAKEWNVRNYIKTSAGNIYEGPININDRDENENFDSFLINYENEPVVDIQQMSVDIDKLQKEQIMVGKIKGGFVSGCIYIDSRSLKGRLTPIPLRSLNEIEKTLKDLMDLKIFLMNRVFKYYSKLLKTESTALEIFVNFCSLLKKIQSLLPNMNSEISFVDEIVGLFEQSHFQEQSNPLHESYSQFKNEFQQALNVKKNHMDAYLLELKKFSYKQTRKLDKYFNLSLLIPKNLQEFDVDSFSQTTEKLKRKIKKMKDSIKTCLNYQKVLETEQSQFDQYKEAMQNIKTSENLIILYIYKTYQEVYKQVTQIPFDQVNFDQYDAKSELLKQEIEKMANKKNCAVFTEISNSFNSFSQYSEELKLLYNGKMQERHWNRLFDECCKKGKYNSKITIHDLIEYNIVGNIGRIKKITEISLNEYKLETEFKEISTHWSEVHIPLANAQAKSEMTMVLAPLDNLIMEINDASIRLHNLLNNPYINGIKSDIQLLSDQMDNIIKVLKAWQIFQPNWVIVSTLFQQEAIQKSITKQQNRFATVKRKYGAIVRHVLNNTRLINVCSFQSLLEDLQENSRDLEIILKDLISFTNLKRMKLPRLFFLSDNELLTMMSTTNFSVFASLFVKTLMHIQKIDAHSKDAAFIVSQDTSKEMCNFNGMSIYSLTGDDCENFILNDHVMCTGPLEDWSSLLYKQMKESFKIEFKKNLQAFKENSLSDYIFTALPYFSLLVNSVVFTESVEDCFSHFETNQRIFNQFEAQLIEKETELLNTLTSPLSSSEILKISNLIAAINMNIELVHSFQDKIQGYSHKLKWASVFKHRYNPTTDVLYCEFEDFQIPHNLEYWGDSPKTIVDNTMLLSLINSISLNEIPMLYGPFASGKSSLVEYLAFLFGRFYFQVQPFMNMSKLLIDQYVVGASETGAFLFFRNINEMEIEKIEYLFDKLHIIHSSQVEKKNAIRYNKHDEIEIDLSTRFFMSRRINCDISPPLKSFTRPIAVRTPSINKIIEIMLKSHGFKSYKNSSNKLNSFLKSIISLLDIQKSVIHYSMKIIKNAFEYLLEIVHANRCPFVNYYEESRTAEEFSLALAAYQNIQYMANDEILIQLLYSHFTIFDNIDVFKEHICKPNCFTTDKFETSIIAYLEEKLMEMKIDLPTDYLISKFLDLFNLMKNYTAIVIHGEPNTGKSILIDLLVDVYQNFHDDTKIKGMLPIKLAKVFHNSDSFKNEFGIEKYAKNNESKLFRHNNENGEILSALTYLNRFEETHHRILYLDGFIDSNLSHYLINSTFGMKKVQLSSGDSFSVNDSLHIIIETDSIDDIPDEFKSFVGLISMKSCQYDSIHPSIPFSMASIQFESIINETTMSQIRSIFCDICEPIFKKVKSMKNSNKLIPLFNSYFTYAIELSLSEINENYLGNTNETEVFKLSLIFSIFRVFSTLLDTNQITEFDEYLRRTFELNFPNEWVGYGLPNAYWDIYPTPSVMSMRISNKKINPHNFNILNLIKTDYIPIAQFLPNLTTFNLGLAAHHHFLIFGERYSGKETFIELILDLNKHLTPVHVYLNPSTTAAELKNILLKQSQLTIQQSKLSNNFLLIFHHLDNCKLEVFEFIRMIIVSKSLPVTSSIDSKVYNSISLNNFVVIGTLVDPEKVPIRFFSLFTPILMQNYLSKTKEYIITKAMMKENVVNKIISLINFCLRELDLNIIQMLNIARIICLMPEHNSSKGFVKEFIVFMSEIQYSVFHDDSDGFDRFKLKALKICQDFDMGVVFQQYQAFKKLLVPTFKGNDQIEVNEIDFKELKEVLTKLSGRKLTNLEVKQYIYVAHSISKPKSHCEITGPTSSGKMSIIKLYAKKNKIHLIDMAYSNNEILKNRLVESLLMNVPYLIAIRANKNSMVNLFQLYMLIVLKNYKLLFNDEEQEELYRTLSKTERPTEIQRRDSHFEILKRMECNCHLIILSENELKLSNVDVIRLRCDTKEHICDEILNDQIELKSIFCEIAQKVEEQLPFSHQNQFYDFIKTFDETFKKEKDNQKNRSQKINLALSFYDKIIEDQKTISNNMAELKPLVHTLKDQTKEIADELDLKMKAVEEKKNKLNEELMLKQAEFKQKRQEYLDSDAEYQLSLPKFEAVKQKISELNDQQLQPLRIYCAAPTPLVKSFSEACCLLTNRTNDVKIFSNYNLTQILTDEIDFKKISSENLNSLKKLIEKDIDQKQIENGPPVLNSIFIYFQRTVKIASMFNTCKSKQNLVMAAQKSLDVFNESMKKEYDELAEVEQTFTAKQSELNDLQKKLEETKSEYKKKKSDKRVIETILKDIMILIDKWREEQSLYLNLANTLKGDTIIWVVYLIYAGMLPQDKRMKLIDSVNDILIRENISVSFTNPIEFIEPKLISSKFMLNTNIPKPLLIDFHHLSLAIRVPLVIDIDGLVLNSINKNEQVYQISLNSLSFEKVACSMYQKSVYLVVTDVDRLTPLLTQMIGGDNVILYDNEEVLRNPEFHLILFTDNPNVEEFNSDLLSRVTLINTTNSSLDGVKMQIIYSFVDYFDSDLLPRVKQSEKLEITQQEEIDSYENSSLDLFAFMSKKSNESKEYIYLDDSETISEFCRSKDCYFAFHIQTDSYHIKKELELTIHQYKELIDVCYNVWLILTRYIKKISPIVIKLSKYLDTITNVFVATGFHTLTNEQVQILKNALLNAFYQLIFPSLNYNEIILYIFLISYFSRRLPEADLEMIFEHIASEYDGKALFDQIDLDGSTNSDNLKFSAIDHIFQIIFKFTNDVIGRDYLNFMPSFNIDTALSSQISFLYSDDDKEPTNLLMHFITIRNMSDIVKSITLNDFTINKTKKLLINAIQDGFWVIVNYSRSSIKSSLLINEIPTLLKSANKVHENFKLILNCRTTDHLSFEIMEMAKFIRIDAFPSVRETMQEIYHHHSPSLKVLEHSNNGRKIAYLSALVFAQNQYRNFLKPCGFNAFDRQSIWSFIHIISLISKFIEMNNFSIRNYREILEQLITGFSVIDNKDKLKIKFILSNFIAPESFDDSFNFLGPNSTETDKWFISSETTIQGYTQFISRMPSFASCDILCMPKQPADLLLNWNLSRYISLAFKKLYESSKSMFNHFDNGETVFNYRKILQKQEENYANIRKRLLHQIPLKIQFEVNNLTPLMQFWSNETIEFNQFIDILNIDLTLNEIKIEEGVVPDKWQKYKSMRSLHHFISFLNEKRSFLSQKLTSKSNLILDVDISMISDVRAFFNAYMANYACEKQINLCSLYYEFSFDEGNEHKSLVIENLVMMNGKIENGLLVNSTKPFNKLPKLFCKICKRTSIQNNNNEEGKIKSFNCPVYKFVCDSNLSSINNEIHNEMMDNYVIDIPLQTEKTEKFWVLNGTSIFCNMPSQFGPV